MKFVGAVISKLRSAALVGMRVLGVSCITNMAAGILPQPLNHAEVTETANRVKDRFKGLLDAVIGRM